MLCVLCRCPDHIVLIGTCHVGEQSERDVTRVINSLKPDAVVVELCRFRSKVFYESTGEVRSRDRFVAKSDSGLMKGGTLHL